MLPPREVVLGLAAANGLSFVAGAVLGQVLLRRRLGRIPTSERRVDDRAHARRRLVGALAAAGVVALIPWDGLAPLGRAWLQLVVAVVVTTPVVLVGLRLLRVRELDPLFRRIERLVDRDNHTRRTPS